MAKEVPAQTEWAIRKDKVHLTFQVIEIKMMNLLLRVYFEL